MSMSIVRCDRMSHFIDALTIRKRSRGINLRSKLPKSRHIVELSLNAFLCLPELLRKLIIALRILAMSLEVVFPGDLVS